MSIYFHKILKNLLYNHDNIHTELVTKNKELYRTSQPEIQENIENKNKTWLKLNNKNSTTQCSSTHIQERWQFKR